MSAGINEDKQSAANDTAAKYTAHARYFYFLSMLPY